LSEALCAGVPIKVLVQIDDLLEQAAPGRPRLAFGVRGSQLAAASMSLGDVYVLQGAASNLLHMRDRLQRGLRHAGPALFSVYSAPAGDTTAIPGYLVAAAAMQSRAFPSFVYDPGAGADFASRFSLENNPQPERDWPVEALRYADPDLQAVVENLAFTFVDFALCDPRHAAHFSVVPRAGWVGAQVPAAEWFDHPPVDAPGAVPYVVAVDDADMICRVVVDDSLMRAALRCRENWHRLQELAGIRDSRLERRLAQERAAWEQLRAREAPGTAVAPATAIEVPGVAESPAAAAATATEPARNPDEACIETIRCSSCNECTLAFPQMFAYNDDKQAYIKDLKAGTYRQLVEAAESCQVSVIHPGQPWDPGEPGLDELIERAKPFR
jgi:ferredoxin